MNLNFIKIYNTILFLTNFAIANIIFFKFKVELHHTFSWSEEFFSSKHGSDRNWSLSSLIATPAQTSKEIIQIRSI